MTQVRDLMTVSCVTVSPTTPVLEARQLMVEKRIRHLLVTDGPGLVGIVTDRDIRLNLPSPATSLSVWEINYLLARMTVGTVMTKNVLTIESGREPREAAQILLDHTIGALPVVDHGRLVGIITETDLLRAFVKGG
jgi:acetoin utilization protein AcuB